MHFNGHAGHYKLWSLLCHSAMLSISPVICLLPSKNSIDSLELKYVLLYYQLMNVD